MKLFDNDVLPIRWSVSSVNRTLLQSKGARFDRGHRGQYELWGKALGAESRCGVPLRQSTWFSAI